MQILKIIKQWTPIFVILILVALFFITGLYKYLTLDAIRGNLHFLQQLVMNHLVLASIAFVLIYALSVSTPTPTPTILNIIAGTLFPLPVVILYVCCGETLGGLVLYKSTHSALGKWLTTRTPTKLKKIQQSLSENATALILGLRFLCIAPSWIMNMLCGLTKIPTKQYLLITFLGSVPAAIIYGIIGEGLKKILVSGEKLSPALILKPEFIFPIMMLVVFVIAYWVFSKLRNR